MTEARKPSKPWRVYGARGMSEDYRGQRAAYDAVNTITRLGSKATVYHWEHGSWRKYEVIEPETAIAPAAGKTAEQWADEIMPEILEDIAAGMTRSRGERVPFDVDDFTTLHDYTDANMYLINHLPESFSNWTTEAECQASFNLGNAITDEISRRLAARALTIRRQMADVITFDLGWFVPEPDLDPDHEREEVLSIADAFADPDCDLVTLDGLTFHDREQIAEYARRWFTDAEAWLMNGRSLRPADIEIGTPEWDAAFAAKRAGKVL
jgi:hypothetical protein